MRVVTIGLTAVAAVTVALPLLPAFTPRAALASGVVGTGSAASCTDAAFNAALAGGGLVTFNCGGPATIDISTGTGTKTISADTTIDGGSLITISGGNSVGVFSVNTGVKFTVQNLTVANGSAKFGGGISNGGTLTVTNTTFSGNSGSNGGEGRGGGGISNNASGTVTITNSTFSGNSAANSWGGGGIFSVGPLTVINSTFSGNSAIVGGGIVNNVDPLTVTNSTFFGNSASYGGGIYNYSGTVTVTNTIVANSTSGGNCASSVTDGGHNIDDGTTCGFAGTGCTFTTGTSFCNTNPGLDPTGLQNNGGPTQTIALQATSAAVDGGDETVCSMTTGAAPVHNLDQRGFIRPGAGHTHCSTGAYEFYSPGPACIGDCGDDGTVTVDELLTMVNIALGKAQLSDCSAGDANHDGQISVDEILAAVNNALNGCSS